MEKRRVLLVDDNDEFRVSFTAILEEHGLQVTDASNVIAAENELLVSHYDLIITDILMPDRDGIEFLATIKKLNLNCKVIVVSGGDMLDAGLYLNAARYYKSVVECLRKPFTPEQLIASIEGVFTP